MSNIFTIYTDGGYISSEEKIGAWAYIILDPNSKETKILEKHAQGEIETTNNKMELTAAIKALHKMKDLKDKYDIKEIHIYTDSQYLQRGMVSWIQSWKKNNWKSKYSNQPIKNRELWEELDAFNLVWKVKYYWVKGHGDDKLNNQVDQMCQDEIKKTVEAHKKKKAS